MHELKINGLLGSGNIGIGRLAVNVYVDGTLGLTSPATTDDSASFSGVLLR